MFYQHKFHYLIHYLVYIHFVLWEEFSSSTAGKVDFLDYRSTSHNSHCMNFAIPILMQFWGKALMSEDHC